MSINLSKVKMMFKSFLITVLLLVIVDNTAFGKLLGNRSQLDPVLSELVEPLNAKKIDVVAGNTSDIKKTWRPRVALLSGLATNPDEIVTTEKWMKEFISGMTGYVASVKTKTETNTDGFVANTQDEFISKWEKASPDQRVFLSFTVDDVKIAHKIEETLNGRGYVTFVFLNPKNLNPIYDASLVGKMFKEAEHRLVLDTKNARKKPGVLFEALLAANNPSGSDIIGGGEPPNKPIDSSSDSASDSFDEKAFVHGLKKDWVVTKNPEIPNKLFVHREISGGTLVDLLYYVEKESNGSWTVYDSSRNRLGTIKKLPKASINIQ